MTRRAVLTTAVLALMVLTAGFALSTGAAATNHSERPTVDTTATTITIHENGDATWTLELRTPLDSDSDVENYETFQQEFQNTSSQRTATLEKQLQETATAASNNTNRTMNIEGMSASTRIETIPQRWGVVSYTFTWTNFATVTDTQLVVGDAFENGLYLSDTDSLTITTDSTATLNSTSTAPTPDNTEEQTVVWNGERDFSANQPTVTFTLNQAPTAAPSSQRTGLILLLVTGGLLALVTTLGYLYKTRDNSEEDTDAQTRSGTPPIVENSPTHTDDAGENTPTPDDREEPANDSSTTLLSDEEQVIELLKQNNGRIKQSEIVSQTDWSSSKTSRLLTSMEDDGQIKRLRIGRENVVDIDTSDPYEEYDPEN